MQIGEFSLDVLPGKELGEGYIELQHGQTYQIRMMTRNRLCDARVEVDGKHVGDFRVEPGTPFRLERPSHAAKLFTFYAKDSAEAAQARDDKVEPSQRGMIRVTFVPEKVRPVILQSPSVTCADLSAFGDEAKGPMAEPDTKGMRWDLEEKTGGRLRETSGQRANSTGGMRHLDLRSSHKSGTTGLSGHSDQRFIPAVEIEHDLAAQVVITLNLVSDAREPSELTPAPKSPPVVRSNPAPQPL